MAEGPPGVSGLQAGVTPPITELGPPPSIDTSTPARNDEPAAGADEASAVSPTASARRAAPEPNKRALYVGGLDPRVTDEVLKQIFSTSGHVQSVKIIPEKSAEKGGLNYGFVEFSDAGAAERAMSNLNGRTIHDQEIRVNWAYQNPNRTKEDTSNHFHIFIGDLSNEVNDEILEQAFSTFGSVSEARVMWDMKTGRSRGFGFAAFRNREDAEKAIVAMNGEYLGARAIRVNWANQRGQPPWAQQQAMIQMGADRLTSRIVAQYPDGIGRLTLNTVQQSSPQWQTTVYVGNLTPYTAQLDLIGLFHNFGEIVQITMSTHRGFAMVKMDTHENAANAICQLNGYIVNGVPVKCSWAKASSGQSEGQLSSPASQPGYAQTPANYFPQYVGPTGPAPPAVHGHGYGQSPPAYGHPYGSPGYGAPMPPNPAASYHNGPYQGYGYRG